MQNIYLVGFMGSGKSTIGKKLSKKLNLKFLDTDKIIEKKNSMTINQIFYNQGEKFFRNEEKRLLIVLNKYKKTIISTGGGFVCNSRIIDLTYFMNNIFYGWWLVVLHHQRYRFPYIALFSMNHLYQWDLFY